MPNDGWQEYSQYVLNSIRELKDLREQVTGFRIELAVLKVKVTLWGALGGIVGTAIGTLIIQLVIAWMKNKIGVPTP